MRRLKVCGKSEDYEVCGKSHNINVQLSDSNSIDKINFLLASGNKSMKKHL